MTYETTQSEITVIDGLEVDITVRDDGAGENDADKVLMDLLQRAGELGAAFDAETPPDELEEISADYLPLMIPDWEGRFADDGEEVEA